MWTLQVNLPIGHPLNPQQPKGEPLPFVVKLLIFCFCCELLSWDLQLHVMFSEQFQSIKSSGSFTDTFWQVRFSQGLRVCLKSAINYCLSIVSDKWRLRTQACNGLGDHVPFFVRVVSSHCHFDEWPGHMISWSWIGSVTSTKM